MGGGDVSLISQFKLLLTHLQFVFLQRSDIVKATYEPTDEECEWKADDEQELTVSMQVNAAYRPPRTDLDRSQHQVLLS